jgi:hypothetical protein
MLLVLEYIQQDEIVDNAKLIKLSKVKVQLRENMMSVI